MKNNFAMKPKNFVLLCARLLQEILKEKITLNKACQSTKNPKLYFKILFNVLKNYKNLNKNAKLNDHITTITNYLKTKPEPKTQQKFIRINTLKKFDVNKLKVVSTKIKNVYKLNGKFDPDCIFFNNGNYFVQNYSSCIPAFVLNPPKNALVIDTCAAPGNKTTHIAAILENTGKVLAVEKNENRFELLNKMIEKSGAKNVETINCDFTTLEPKKFTKYKFALVDPSCSGSGIHKNYKKDDERLKNLQCFQIKILNHLAKFEGIEKFVYSTCSVEVEENEMVVGQFLKNNKHFELLNINIDGLESGDKNFWFWEKVIRVKPGKYGEIGFFVALFKRIKE